MTSDGIPEHVLVTASGDGWTNLQVRFEIRSPQDNLLFSHEWNSGAWFGNVYYPESDEDAEKRSRQYVKSVVDTSRFGPGILGQPRANLIPNGLRYFIRLDIAEQLWREKNQTPMHQHLIMMREGRNIAEEFAPMIPEERINNLMEECIDGPSYTLRPHWDGAYAVVWSKSEERFVIAFFIG
ncbi:hypothetical protein ACFL3H_05525 [Gemmatimonadota bacterium]